MEKCLAIYALESELYHVSKKHISIGRTTMRIDLFLVNCHLHKTESSAHSAKFKKQQ